MVSIRSFSRNWAHLLLSRRVKDNSCCISSTDDGSSRYWCLSVPICQFSSQLINVLRSFVFNEFPRWVVFLICAFGNDRLDLGLVALGPLELQAASIDHCLSQQVVISAIAKLLHSGLHGRLREYVHDCWPFLIVFRKKQANHVSELFRILRRDGRVLASHDFHDQ